MKHKVNYIIYPNDGMWLFFLYGTPIKPSILLSYLNKFLYTRIFSFESQPQVVLSLMGSSS